MRLALGLAAMLAATAALAQSESPPPRDAPYFPTPQSVVDRMLQLAKVGRDDFVIDLGSGDGRIVITAAKKYGARGIGIEIEPRLVSEANYYARRDGVGDRAKFIEQDLFETDLRPATVLTLYLFRELNIKLAPRILAQLRPGARVVSHDWDLGDWPPDHQETMPAPDKAVGTSRESKVFLWYVPARCRAMARRDYAPPARCPHARPHAALPVPRGHARDRRGAGRRAQGPQVGSRSPGRRAVRGHTTGPPTAARSPDA
jgi:hypothetical protein